MTRLVFYTPMLINWNERPTVARGGGTGSSFSPVCSKRGQVVSWLGIEIIYLMYAQKGPPTGASSGVHGYPPACSRTNFILGRVSTDTRTINRTETEQFSPRRYFFRSPPRSRNARFKRGIGTLDQTAPPASAMSYGNEIHPEHGIRAVFLRG